MRSAVRLIGAGAATDSTLRAGIEIRLDRGWKTYWRYPGDSGVPPRFDSTSGAAKAADTSSATPATSASNEGASLRRTRRS